VQYSLPQRTQNVIEPAKVFRDLAAARQHSKTSPKWSKVASAGARQSALVNARLRPLGFRPVGLQPAGSEQILVEDTIDLDARRGTAAQKATRMRRQLAAFDAGHAARRTRQEELEQLILAAPATSWVEAVAKARYLLIWIARSPAAEDPRRATLIADVFADFKRLLADPKNPPVAGDAGLAPTSLIQRRIAMAKGQQRGNREAKKPKKEKPKVAATAQASFGLNPSKSTGAKDDRKKKK
jgi:hypothetical protein